MKKAIVLLALLGTQMAHAQTDSSVAYSTAHIAYNVNDTTVDSLRFPSYITVEPYNVMGVDAVYVSTTSECINEISNTIDINYTLFSASGVPLASRSMHLSGTRVYYLLTRCLLPTCRRPYVYWLIINIGGLKLELAD